MKNLISIFSILLFAVTIQGQTNPTEFVNFLDVDELDFEVFNKPKYKDYYNKTYGKRSFLNHYFHDWKTSKKNQLEKITDAEWNEYFTYTDITKKSPCYSGNYQLHSEKLIEGLMDNLPQDKTSFPHINRIGITTKKVDIRGLPTDEFCLKAMRDAGEGYPFDYLQYSTLWIGSPVRILSKTIDNLWYFVSTPNNKGWVKAEGIAFVSDNQSIMLQKMEYGAVLKENLVLEGNRNTINLNIGVILPIIKTGQNRSALIPYNSFQDNKLAFDTIPFQVDNIKEFPIRFDSTNVKRILTELMGGKYSWGGLHNGRDCSSTLKDYFAPFGIWLPRNSSQQYKNGKQIELPESEDEKINTIINEGVPFLSSVFKWGHIMLYVGKDKKSEPLIFHTIWGLKAFYKDEAIKQVSDFREEYGIFGIDKRDFFNDEVQARLIIGQTVITEIEPIKELKKLDKIRVDSFLGNIFMLTIMSDKSKN